MKIADSELTTMALHGAWPIVKYQVTIARPAGAYASDARPSQGAAPHDTYLKHIHDFKPYLKNTHDLVHGTPFERCRSQQQVFHLHPLAVE